MKNMFMNIDKLPLINFGSITNNRRKIKIEPFEFIPKEPLVPVTGPEEKFMKYLDLMLRIENNRKFSELDLLDRCDVEALDKEVRRILNIKDKINLQLTLLFDEYEISEQMKLFNFEYIGISKEMYDKCLNRAMLDRDDEIKLFVFEDNWFNIVNQKLYLQLKDMPGIKDNLVAKLWLFYTFIITAESRCYDWRMIGTTYITYVSNNTKVPVRDALFYSWMEGLLKLCEI